MDMKKMGVRALGVVGVSAAAVGPASAALSTEVTTAFTGLSADITEAGGLILIATVGVAVFKFIQAVII